MNVLSFEALEHYWSMPEMATNVVIFLNLFGALLLGLLVGYERSYHGRAAGMRTYGLVCMASAALTVVSGYPSYWFGGHAIGIVSVDPTRTIQGIVTGIGFLGAGIIMKDGLNISGLTTAASIWAASAIGVMVGLGFYAAAILLALLSAVFMMWGSKIEMFLPSRQALSVSLQFQKDFIPAENAVHKMMTSLGYEVARGSFSITQKHGLLEWKFVAIALDKKRGTTIVALAAALPKLDGVENFQLSHARN